MSRSVRWLALGALPLVALALPLPEEAVPPAPVGGREFVWRQDSVWQSLESRFVEARAAACADSTATRVQLEALDDAVTRLERESLAPDAAHFDAMEAALFAMAPHVAACGPLVPDYVTLRGRVRDAVKTQSLQWDVSSVAARDRLYRTLYGGRAAVEEVMLQQPDAANRLQRGAAASSTGRHVTPSAESNGVTLHSGDLLVSRGGFPTSALIARGNDYPGNFSHIALVHIDSLTRAISVVEAHIESGVSVSTADAYLADKKLRVMVLRLRPDLPAMQRDPMLPHRAASAMLARARAEQIPYDFAMDYTDPSALFCSEVASAAYATQGLTLWMGISTISRDGLRRWLAGFGVRHFATQEPSDLEYDPQVEVVAEWHDAATLFADHIDNAVTDVMLEEADVGATLDVAWYTVPLARVMKAYSWVRVQLGSQGPIPEGMAPVAALRNRSYGAQHAARAAKVREAAAQWEAEQGYPPAYWTLVALARETTARP